MATTIQDIRIDKEFRSLIPAHSVEERNQLERNLIADGCRDPLVTWENTLLDGHTRLEICETHDIEYQTVGLEFNSRKEAMVWMRFNQLGRRNISPLAAIELARGLREHFEAEAKERQGTRTDLADNIPPNSAESKDTRDALADAANMGHDTYAKGEYLLDHADDAAKERIRTKKSSVNAEYKILKRAEKPEPSEAPPLPTGEYDLIYCDPPWRYDHQESPNRDVENQYPTMTVEEICALDVPAADDCVLFMWATSPKLQEALEAIEAWGFTYKTHAIWDKLKIGMGYWFRGQHELLLVATKGKMSPPHTDNRVSSVFSYKRGKHSAKPIEVYDLIEQMLPNTTRIELFARTEREGWDSWGNETA